MSGGARFNCFQMCAVLSSPFPPSPSCLQPSEASSPRVSILCVICFCHHVCPVFDKNRLDHKLDESCWLLLRQIHINHFSTSFDCYFRLFLIEFELVSHLLPRGFFFLHPNPLILHLSSPPLWPSKTKLCAHTRTHGFDNKESLNGENERAKGNSKRKTHRVTVASKFYNRAVTLFSGILSSSCTTAGK